MRGPGWIITSLLSPEDTVGLLHLSGTSEGQRSQLKVSEFIFTSKHSGLLKRAANQPPAAGTDSQSGPTHTLCIYVHTNTLPAAGWTGTCWGLCCLKVSPYLKK